ncbi:MAG: hypothetical protein AB7O92_12075 [Acidimicrobiia bacterium]
MARAKHIQYTYRCWYKDTKKGTRCPLFVKSYGARCEDHKYLW